MEGTRIAFRFAPYDRDWASELVKRLVGQATSSHGRTYACRRKRLLDEIPHLRLAQGVIIVRAEDAERVVGYQEDLGAEVHARTVTRTREDRDCLQLWTLLRLPHAFSEPAGRFMDP